MTIQGSASCTLLLALLCEVPAQTPQPERPPVPTPSTSQTERLPTLHDAWLFEVIDLDIKKAVAAYEKVAADQRPGNLDRWVAVARLAELKRLGVDVTLRVDLKEVPEPVRAALEANSTPLPVADLLQRLEGNPADVLQRVGTEPGLPPLHPITMVAEEWRLAQIPSLRETLAREQSNRARSGAIRSSDWVNLNNAADILRAELGGWRSQADARRALWFSNWHPPKLGDPRPYLEKFRTNLEAWLRDPELTRWHRDLLIDLRTAFNEKATTDPSATLALVARVPVFAERLLGLAPSANR